MTTPTLNNPMNVRASQNKKNGPLTPAQRDYITSLVDKHKIDQVYIDRISRLLDAPFDKGGMTLGEGSDIIEWLKKQPLKEPRVISRYTGQPQTPRSQAVVTAAVQNVRLTGHATDQLDKLPVGVYSASGMTYYMRVREQQRRATDWRPAITVRVYESVNKAIGSTGRMYPGDALAFMNTPGFSAVTTAEAKRLTRLFKRCMICGKKLHTDVSVDRGIGPVCFKRLSIAQAFKQARP